MEFINLNKKFFSILFLSLFISSVWAADFLAAPKNVKYLGRTYFDGTTLWTGFSAAGAAFKTNSKSLEVTFAGDSTARGQKPDGDVNIARVGIFVDDVRKANVLITQKEQKVSVDFSGTNAWREIKIIKLSESANSICGISKIKIDDGTEIKPLDKKPYKIEFIGDSITCGYGVDDENRNHHFSTQTEDATKTYAYKSAQALNADYSMVSLSGWGIISGYSGNGAKQSNQVISLAYDKFAYSYGGTFGAKSQQPQSIAWDFSQFQPDIIVINLGTNDASYTKNQANKCKEFEDGYVTFLKTVRQKNPNAKIICALGLMGADLYPSIQNAVKAYSNETGDKKVSTAKLPQTQFFAADWHPAERSHENAASALTKFIKDNMGWQ